MRTGQPVSNWQGRLEITSGRSTHVMISATPLFTDTGRVRGAIAAIVDVTEHKQAEEKQQALLHELQHRVKNILATVSSLATRMARRSESISAFRDAFLSRITAMGRMHDLLAGGASGGASLRSLIETAVRPYLDGKGRNVRLVGSEIRLVSSSAAIMGMILHELVTNASKYGALSVPDAVVDVAWEVTGEQRLRLSWSEHDGARVSGPVEGGFGTSFIKRSVEYELRGTAVFDCAAEGLRCTIEIPLRGNVEGNPARGG